MATDHAVAPPKLSSEIKLELISSHDVFLPKIAAIVESVGQPEGKPVEWSRTLQKYLADGDALIMGARSSRLLAGFIVLEPATLSAPFSWVAERFRDKGLGQRFYSFACVSLAMPTPEFVFHKDLLDEYRFVVKAAELSPVLKDPFYVIHERHEETRDAA